LRLNEAKCESQPNPRCRADGGRVRSFSCAGRKVKVKIGQADWLRCDSTLRLVSALLLGMCYLESMNKVMSRDFYTIGYEGSRLEDFVRILVQAGIKTLIDVRELPLSRKRGFSKSALAATLEQSGIGYVHLKGLGDPKPGRDAARAGEHGRFRRIFRSHMATDVARLDLDRAIELIEMGPCCLMCLEQEHAHCHRSIVAEHIVARTGFALHHICTKGHVPAHEQRTYLPGFAAA